jgi:ElaA protein
MHTARGDTLTARELEAILVLRTAVFVVEQECPYQEVDGRDTEPGTWHAWLSDDDGVAACLRVLSEPDGHRRIGRVCTAMRARRRGLAGRLVEAALAELGAAPAVLDAQSHATDLYARFGFAPVGPEFLEDGIPHVTMRRPGRGA